MDVARWNEHAEAGDWIFLWRDVWIRMHPMVMLAESEAVTVDQTILGN